MITWDQYKLLTPEEKIEHKFRFERYEVSINSLYIMMGFALIFVGIIKIMERLKIDTVDLVQSIEAFTILFAIIMVIEFILPALLNTKIKREEEKWLKEKLEVRRKR